MLLKLITDNATTLFGILSLGFIGIGISKGIAKLFMFVLNSKVNKLIVKYIPEGIALGDILKGEKSNEERLYQAVVTVENKVLNALPDSLKGMADKLIDSRQIVKEIERELNKRKYGGLAKPTIEQ